MYISIHAYFGHAIYYSAANIEYDYLWTVLVGYPIGCSSMPDQRMFWQQEQHDGIDFGRVFVHAHDRQIISFIIDIFISPHSHRPRPFDLSICCLASNECNTLWRLVFRWNVYACIYMFAIYIKRCHQSSLSRLCSKRWSGATRATRHGCNGALYYYI